MKKYVIAGVLAAGGLLAVAGPAGAGTGDPVQPFGSCGQVVNNVRVSGAQASWSHSCSNGNIRVSGWVKDTSADGKCAQVKAEYSNGTQWSAKACPKDQVKYFDFNGPGSSVPVYLFTV
ncbi:hypothetical protein Sme01_69550 [Sphaerisporangium melleum]|uniref:Secreted protein n=2 Tax=Sphaerisporangium melleum TaxID=321316 RepID=A0A917RKY7_9ACTN|nr:hypothetical protein GCM10007964_62980 [Sphaerisporangium melleum]GII74479.1 hypothetical protein Sme01_69550 [Sphaerisporangium melleum]